MHRTNGDSYGTAQSAQGQSVRVYRNEVPGVTNATQLRVEEMTAIQEEIANVIESTGATLLTDAETPAQMIQLNTAINSKLATLEQHVEGQITTVNNALDARLDVVEAHGVWNNIAAYTAEAHNAGITVLAINNFYFTRIGNTIHVQADVDFQVQAGATIAANTTLLEFSLTHASLPAGLAAQDIYHFLLLHSNNSLHQHRIHCIAGSGNQIIIMIINTNASTENLRFRGTLSLTLRA